MSKKRIYIPVTEIQYERLKELAALRGVPLSQLVERSLEALLKIANKHGEIKS
ncbi:ribbon-helix-helix domain-containing protein [Oxalobacter formigenes]|uniref:ribbon-helix-helix domain-containing protein n=1 Tax=Oxalobacter formigenes TaxID=847 RepID=UPI0022AF3F6B|nr:ribbon-helix-helix domain-containing protein [Oxalobacter formigenes]WAW06063.1 ribbon-helix-helix domain-containing protein [Oxalobacter formigenes]